ncbi:ABC transporter substrate-binding protein [Sporosarcina sp. ACRSM]|uniref:ABC transporter substrate-binding protein n=1 Tax=Sporosarcina sp. ACRSM TaxID=2918216 RepID=UPI001EF67A92|nr:ABC transporter substrate-binding protein [Sporosarcina sp. ACRSM]MCG7336312.1 ABC transporter substrate-binding protein [Sporosarcina sp. ACRSM]
MKRNFKGKVILFLALTFLLMIAGCGGGNARNATADINDEEVVKIGVIVAETGPASTLGSSQANTVKLLQKQLDAAGPIDGKTIQLVKHDYETDDTKAVVAMDKLISDGVVAVVGATQSSTSMAIMPKAIEKKLPLFTIAPIESDSEYVYSMAHSTTVIAMPIVEYLNKNNIKKVAWLNAADGFGVTGKPAFEALAKENGIEIVAHEEFDATATDMTIQLTKVRKTDPEAIIVWSRTPGAGIVARNYKALGFDIPMIQSTAAANDGFLEQVKDDNQNIMVVGSKLSVVDQLPDSEQKEILKGFKDSYAEDFNGEPDLFAAHLLDGIQAILEAVKAGHVTSEDIQQYLQNDMGKYLGATGTFDFGVSQASPEADGISVISIENNTWKYND